MFAFRLWLPGHPLATETFPSCSTLRSQGAEEASATERASDDEGCTAMLPSTEKKGALPVAICRQKSNSTVTSKTVQDHRMELGISSVTHHFVRWSTVFSPRSPCWSSCRSSARRCSSPRLEIAQASCRRLGCFRLVVKLNVQKICVVFMPLCAALQHSSATGTVCRL